MSDSLPASEATPGPSAAPATAGGLLRQARQARGLHIAALATSMKVTPHKLELLESDRFDELPGATFTRALAQTVCRTLKIDAAPVLALLPSASGQGLDRMSRGLNEPFRDRPGRSVPTDLAFLKNPVLLGAVVLVALATVVSLVPAGWVERYLPGGPGEGVSTPGASGTEVLPPVASDDSVPPGLSGVSVETVPVGDAASAAPGVSAAPVVSASAPAVPPAPAPAASGALRLSATAASWVEVIDRRGVAVLSRLLQPGETVAVDGTSPLRVRIGNATATQVTYNGETVDLTPLTSRENVARLELK